jgi:hypothetical protein
MPETFFILLSAGVMLAAAVPRSTDVTLRWLRLAGILALVFAGLSMFFLWQRDPSGNLRPQWGLFLMWILPLILLQLCFAQLDYRSLQRLAAAAAAFAVVGLGVGMFAGQDLPSALALLASCAGIAAMTGLVLMDMLLGHAYLTASKMTMRPFRRLNDTLLVVIVLRILTAVGGVLWMNARRPVPMFWGVYGLYTITRWLVGLAVPLVFVYMARDCIIRRSTQSATGILYVAGVLIFVGEILALHLVRETGLPF